MQNSRRLIDTFAFLAAFFWYFFALPAAASNVFDRIVARVNNNIITLSEVEERQPLTRSHYASRNPSEMPSERELRQETLDLIIEEKLLVQEGKRISLVVDDESVDKAVADIIKTNKINNDFFQKMLVQEGLSLAQYKERIRDQILISKVKRAELRNRIQITEKKSKRYYDENLKKFWIPPKIHARHILFAFPAPITASEKKAKREKAEEVLRKIHAGADFKEMAAKFSDDTSGSGGDLGVLEMGKMVKEFESAAFKLRKGEVSSIVESPYGLHIIKAENIVPGKTRIYDEVKGEIEEILFSQEAEKKYKVWIAELRKKAFVEVSLFDDAEKPGQKTINGENHNGVSHKTVNGAKEPRKEEAKVLSDDKVLSEDIERATREAFGDTAPKAVSKRYDAPAPPPAKEAPPVKPVKSANNSAPAKKPEISAPPASNGVESMEKRLQYIKILRDHKIITESEYEKRKKEVLNKL